MVKRNIIDELFRTRVGSFGFWQQSTVFLAATFGVCYVLVPAIVNITPPHFCKPTTQVLQQWNNISQQMNLSFQSKEYWQSFIHWYIPPASNISDISEGQNYSACHHYVDPEEGNFETRPCENSWIYLTEYSIFRKTVTEEFDLVCDRRWLRSMDTAVYTGGMFTGYLLVGPLSDAYGRRITYLAITTLLVCVTLLTSVATTYTFYMVLRYFIAIFCNANYSAFSTLISECSVNEYRPWITTMGFLTYCFVDRAIFLTLAYVIQHWRWFYVSLGAVTSCSAIFIYYLPESPHWSLAHGRQKDVVDTMNFIAGWNHWFRDGITNLRHGLQPPDESQNEEYIPITREIFSEECHNDFVASDERKSVQQNLSTLHELLQGIQSLAMIKRCLGQTFVWFFIGMSYYGLTFYSVTLFGNPFVALFAVGIFAVPGDLAQAPVSNRFGRRNPIFCSLVLIDLLLLIMVLLLFFYRRDHIIVIVTAITATIFCLTELSSGISITYSVELFPTSLRNMGTAYLNGVLCIAGGISVFVNDLERYTGESYVHVAVYFIVAILATCGVLILPETVNSPLPENVDDIQTMKSLTNNEHLQVQQDNPIDEMPQA